LHADFELGGWSVRPGRLILEREGETAHVKPKTMDVLVCLAERAGAVVSREELLTRVWQNVYVTDDVITQAIAELRRAVHDDRRQPAFLETVPRRGYRLLQPVRFSEREIAPSRAAAADTVPRSIVARRRFRWEALLATAAMTVVFLGWVAVREGSIIRSELQLLRAARQTPSDPRPTQDTEAYEHYLKARQKFRPYSPEPNQMVEALSLATRAVERDPQFAQAHALIAEIETFRGFWNRGARDEVLRRAREAADAALAIDPSLSYPHAVSGLATAVLDWKWEEGYRLAVRGSELDPDDVRSMSLRAVLSLTRGKSAEAVQLAYRAYALEPINPHTVGILSWVLYQARQFDEAAGFMAKTLEVDANALFARNFRPLALAYASRFEDALAAERDRPPHPAHRENLALILALAGRPDEARRCLLELDPSADAVETAWGVLGEKEIVLKRLERLIEKRMTNYLMWLRTAPAWDPVRGDARFDRALRRVGLTDPGPPDPTGAPQ
jgi:DNA-binding winged helix-turn-helix (wHTH) protein